MSYKDKRVSTGDPNLHLFFDLPVIFMPSLQFVSNNQFI